MAGPWYWVHDAADGVHCPREWWHGCDASCHPHPQAVAVTGHKDGFGSCFKAQLETLAFARAHCLHYQFLPFTQVSHGSGKNITKVISFTGLKSDTGITNHTRVHVWNPNAPQNFAWLYTPGVRKEAREMYFSTPKPDPCVCDVAIHIRRGDVKKGFRFTANEKYVQLLDILAHHRPEAKIVIYSTGSSDQFQSIMKDREHVRLFLFPDFEMAFHAMVMAPLLITASSAFSKAAAMLRTNAYTHCPPPNIVAVTEACLSRLNWGRDF